MNPKPEPLSAAEVFGVNAEWVRRVAATLDAAERDRHELIRERDALRKALEKILADHIVARECPLHLWNEARALLNNKGD